MKTKNTFFIFSLWFIILSLTVVLPLGIVRRSYRTPIQTCLDPEKPVVALTFDDGPNPEITPLVLDILYENQVPATFFVCGKSIDGNEDLLKDIVENGHELGNHTNTHPDLTTLTQQEIQSEINLTQQKVSKIVPNYSLYYFRPPYGRYNDTVTNSTTDQIVLWDVDSDDWEATDIQTIYNHVFDNVKDQDIIIFHDDNQLTVHALKQIIPTLKANGFQFVTLSQLYDLKE